MMCIDCGIRVVLSHERCYRCYPEARKAGVITVRPYRKAHTSCAIEGCERIACVGGLCRMHYQRNYRHGDPLAHHGGRRGT